MSTLPNPNTILALERLMQEIQHLVDHPRIQQRTWVASGKRWLPILQIVYGELTGKDLTSTSEEKSLDIEGNGASWLVEVNGASGQTFVNIALADVRQIEVYRGGEPGHRYIRGAHSHFTLKDGRKYLTRPDEAQRLVDALNHYNSNMNLNQK